MAKSGEKAAVPLRAIAGSARSGKTAALVERVRTLLESGVAAGDILLVSPSHDGAINLGRRVREACGDTAASVRVVSARALELGILEEAAGTPVRLLLDVEQSIALADLKAAGVAPAELEGLWGLMAQAWARGVAPSGEAAAAMERLLERRGALVPQAVAYRAWEALRTRRVSADHWGAAHVLVDDANGLSRVALECLRELARVELWAAGDPTWHNALFDPGAQADEFVVLANEVVELLATPWVGRAPEWLAVKWIGLEEELSGAATATMLKVREQTLRQRGQGIGPAEIDGVLPVSCAAQVAVAVPARAYAASLVAILGAQEQPVSQVLACRPLGGDPRRLKTCSGVRAFASLGMLAQDDDVASWRTWAALGHADLASGPWLALEAQAEARGCSILTALAELKPQDFEGADLLVDAYERGRTLIERYGSRVGWGLVRAVEPQGSKEFDELCEPLGGDEPAAVIFGQVRANVFDRHYSCDPARVRVGCPESFMGMEPVAMLVLGCNEGVEVDGVLGGREDKALTHALACGRESAVAFYAQRCPVEIAKKLGVRYRRTRRDEDVELAVLAPSPALAALGQGAPPTLSGQQYASVVLGVRG